MTQNTTRVDAFREWLSRAGAGQQLEYHRGDLARDRWPSSDQKKALGSLADAALTAAEDGLVHLVQRRNGESDFSYVAIKRGAPASAEASPARPLAVAA